MSVAAQIQAFFAGLPVNLAASADASLLIAGSQPIYLDSANPLGLSATFVGVTRDLGASPSAFHSFKAVFNASHASATGGAKIQMSNDNLAFRDAATATLVADAPMVLSVPVVARYYRVQLVNAGVAQTALMINSAATRLS